MKETREYFIWAAAKGVLQGIMANEGPATHVDNIGKDANRAILYGLALVEAYEKAGLAPWEVN